MSKIKWGGKRLEHPQTVNGDNNNNIIILNNNNNNQLSRCAFVEKYMPF
jgi:hypothetical protein